MGSIHPSRAALATSFSFLGAQLGSLVSSTPPIVFDVVILLFAWVSFAVEGAPRVDGTNAWPSLPTTSTERPVLVFDSEISLVDDPQPATRRFWVG